MKVISVEPDGNALVEFENLHRLTTVIGKTAAIRAIIPIASIPDIIRIGQQGRRAAQKINSIFAKM